MRNIEEGVNRDEYLKRGEACGMLHYADLQSKYAQKNDFIMYAETFDSLIEEGWTVAEDAWSRETPGPERGVPNYSRL